MPLTTVRRKFNSFPRVGVNLNYSNPLMYGLGAYWPMNEGAGNLVKDVYKNHHGIFKNANIAPWRSPKSQDIPHKTLTFDGSNDWIDCGTRSDILMYNKPLSISAWVFLTGLGASGAMIVGKQDSGGTLGVFFRLVTTNAASFVVLGSTNLTRTAANNSVTANRWHHVSMTWDGSTTAANAKIFVNTVEPSSYQATTNGVTLTDNTAGNIGIGNRGDGARAWTGCIANVKVWNRVLTRTEIYQDYINPWWIINDKPKTYFFPPFVNARVTPDKASATFNINQPYVISDRHRTVFANRVDVSFNTFGVSTRVTNRTSFSRILLKSRIGNSSTAVSELLWMNSSSYRKNHTIIGSSDGALTDYTIKLTVHYGAGTDSGSDVYLNSKCLSTFADIRFGDADGNEYPHWIESKTNSDNAVVWVKIDTIPASPATKIIFIYYGNVNSDPGSSIEDTFPVGIDGRETNSIIDTTLDLATGVRPSLTTPAFTYSTTSSDLDGKTIREPGNILYDPSDTGKEYKTWYTGVNTLGQSSVMAAYSSDGISWTKYGISLTPGNFEDPYVYKRGVGDYIMWYEDVPNTNGSRYGLSSNGMDFTDQGPVTMTNGRIPVSPTIYVENGTYYMFYEDYSVSLPTIRVASSANGIAWTDIGIVLDRDQSDAGAWERKAIVPDDIIKIGSTYYMSYHASRLVSGVETWSGNMAYSDSLTSGWTRYSANPFHIPSNGNEHTSTTIMFNTQNNAIGLLLTFQPNKAEYWNINYTRNNNLSFKYQGGTKFGTGSGVINMYPNNSRDHSMQIVSGIIDGLENSFAMRTRLKLETNKTNYVGFGFGNGYNEAQDGNNLYYGVVSQGYDYFWQASGGNKVFLGRLDGTFPSVKTNLTSADMTLANMNNYRINEFFYKNNGQFDYQIEGSSVFAALPQDTTYLTGSKRFNLSVGNALSNNLGGDVDMEYWLVRVITTNQPTSSSWSTEEVNFYNQINVQEVLNSKFLARETLKSIIEN